MSPPEPGPHHWNQPSKHHRAIAFGVAILVLVVLLGSTLFGLLPRQYTGDVVKLAIAVVGAGFTLFLTGYFEHVGSGLRIGGSVGVFVALMFWNPAKNVPDFISEYLNKNFQACRENVQSRQFDVAEEDCAKAAQELPESGTAMHWLALCQYYQEHYRAAITSWKRAVRLGYEPARVYYNIAFTYFRLGEFERAAEEAKIAIDKASGNSALKARAWFVLADAELSLWDFGAGPDQRFDNAVEAFDAFLEIGTPKFKAQAELACILAVKGKLATRPEDKKRNELEAVVAFNAAVNELEVYKKSDAGMQKTSFVDVYGASISPCGTALNQLWQERRPDESYESLITRVRG